MYDLGVKLSAGLIPRLIGKNCAERIALGEINYGNTVGIQVPSEHFPQRMQEKILCYAFNHYPAARKENLTSNSPAMKAKLFLILCRRQHPALMPKLTHRL